MAPDDQSALVAAAAAGDRRATAEVVRRTQADVWRLCAHLVDPDAADDLTQETFLRVLRALGAFRGESSLRTYVLGIARRTCMDELRRRSRRRALLGRLQAAPTRDQHPCEDAVALDHAVAALHPDRRAAFVLTQVLGLSYEEAATACACPVGTVRSRVARARDDLIASLGEGIGEQAQ